MSETNWDDFNVPKAQPIVKLKLIKDMFAKMFEKIVRNSKCSHLRGLEIVSSFSIVLSGNPRCDGPGQRTGLDGQKG